ncbi:hypothetical protein L9F63_008137, partial [Diploptera punctata]
MSTSLAEQLKKLAVPQTSLLLQEKKKLSLLFDPREAAKFDRDTFYEIGISGLEELVKLNPKFEEFHSSLFDLSSRCLERSIEDKKANKKLNKIIRRFLLLLSPYFLIKSAHKALEWLVNRFHIESFNVDDLMSLIFPYYNTRIFVRVLQMIDVSDPANKWHWLHPLQDSGVPLAQTTLFNRCSTDPSFLYFICQTTADAVHEYKGRENSLATLFAFHCTTLIGGLEYASPVNELQVTHILKSLMEGLTSHVLDYTAASYMIVAQLIRRVKLNHRIFFTILHKLAKCRHSSLKSECSILLVMLYQTQYEKDMPLIPVETLNKLVRLSWLPKALAQLRDADVLINILFESLLREIVLSIQTRTDGREEICSFAESFICDVLDSNTAPIAMQVIIENFEVDSFTSNQMKDVDVEMKDEEDDETDSREETEKRNITVNINDAEEIVKWYSTFFQSLERKYPESYDKVIHKYLNKNNAGTKYGRTVRMLLGVEKDSTSKYHLSNIDLFEKIYHPKSALRAEAVRYLIKNFSFLEEHQRELIEAALPARLRDDNPKVLKEVLGFSTEVLIRFVGAETLLEDLIMMSTHCLKNVEEETWSSVATLLMHHICSKQLQEISSLARARILLTILPFIFPVNKNNIQTVMEVFKQNSFVEKYNLLSALSSELKPKGEKVTAKVACSVFVKYLTGTEKVVDTEDLLQITENILEVGVPINIFFLLMILGFSISDEMKPSVSMKALDILISSLKNYQVAAVAGDLMKSSGEIMLKNLKKSLSGYIPLSGFLYCLLQLTKHTSLPTILKSKDCKWWDLYYCHKNENEEALSFAVRMLEVLMTGCGMESQAVRLSYAECLKEFFKVYFPDLKSQLRFLCNVCACPGNKEDGISWIELRLRCLNLLLCLLNDTDCSFSWALNLEEPVIPALMIAAASSLTAIRHMALNCLLKLGSSFGANIHKSTYMTLIEKIKGNYEEIKLDSDQLPLIMYTTLSPDPAVQSLLKASEKSDLALILDNLFKFISSKDTPLYITVGLLNMLESVNSQELFIKLVPLGLEALANDKTSDGFIDVNRSAILCNIIRRLNDDTGSSLKQTTCWNLVHSALSDWNSVVFLPNEETTLPAVLIMQQITREMYDVLDDTIQQNLLSALIKVGTDCEIPEVGSAASKAIRKIVLDCKLIAVELEKMKNVELPSVEQSTRSTRLRSKRPTTQSPSPELLQTEEWRRGVTLLEWIQSKKKLQSTHLLLAPLFSILNKCLQFEEQAPVEYTKQLVLSCILHCCQKLSPDGLPIEKTVLQAFNVEAIVQCIRASPNPQTHHHALLVLAHVAGMMPEQVLHNIMAIFTFMGSSILRQDDAYSYQVISKIVETIVPILVKVNEGVTSCSAEMDGAVCSVLRVFADTVLDVPLHRRLHLYQKLLTTLEPDNSLWLFICLVLEGHVLHVQEEHTHGSRLERGEMPQRQEFILNLTRCFTPSTIISTCIKLVKYVQSLPVDIGHSDGVGRQMKTSSTLALSLVPGLFNAKEHTPKQLRHYRYSICTFLSCLLSSPLFVKQMAELSDEANLNLEPFYQEFIENLLTYVKATSVQLQRNQSEQSVKYWNAILSLSYDILDKVNALLPGPMFIEVIRGLLNHKLPAVRRKSMELLNSRFQHQTEIFSMCDRKAFYKLLDPLVIVMKSIGREDIEPEIETNQQVAMISIKLLARQLAPEDPGSFKQILNHVTELTKSEAVKNNLLASVILCLAELVSVLRAHSIVQLKEFMPAVIKILGEQKDLDSPNLLLLSVVTATQKIVETLCHFLSPYLDKLLLQISILSTKWQHLIDDSKMSSVAHKLKAIR